MTKKAPDPITTRTKNFETRMPALVPYPWVQVQFGVEGPPQLVIAVEKAKAMLESLVKGKLVGEERVEKLA